MKTLLYVLMLLLIGSCEGQNQYGLPEKVYVGPEGDTLTYKSSGCIDYLLLYTDIDSPDMIFSYFGDTLCVEGEWLTAKAPYDGYELEIIVQPMTEGKSRKITLEMLMNGRQSAFVDVQQKR